MKPFLHTGLALVLGFTVVSCAATGGPDAADDGDYYFRATIDGAGFSGDVTDTATWGAFKYHAGSLTISVPENAEAPAEGTFLINILQNYNGAGSYTVGVGGDPNYARYTMGTMIGGGTVSDWTAEATGELASNTTGTVTVSSDSGGVVEGTFTFEGHNKADGSNKMFQGEFRLKAE